MKNSFFSIIIAIFLFIFSIFYSLNWWLKSYKFGLDLSWWIELDYKIDLEEVKKQEDYDKEKENQIIEWLKSIVDKRVESLKINDSVISSASYWDERHIIVQIPLKWNSDNEDNIKKAKEAIWKVVKIKFKELNLDINEEDIKARKEISERALEEIKNSEYDFWVTAKKYRDSTEKSSYWSYKTSLETFTWKIRIDENEIKEWLVSKILESNEDKTEFFAFEEWKITNFWWDWFWIINILDLSWEEIEFEYLYFSKNPSEWKIAKDSKGRELTEEFFVRASAIQNEFLWQVQLVFEKDWIEIFWDLTKRLVNKQLAIFVGWELLTAPYIRTPILDWIALISWDYTSETANALANNINTWVIPAPIYLTSERSIDSKLWNDSLKELINSGIIWILLIFVFLVYTYRLSGVVAGITIIIYTLLILSLVKIVWATLTLASVAGLVLSIWMAIDANILTFERIIDEIKKWKNLRDSTKIWFDKSWTAIWDTNITGLLIAFILFVFWINMIKWFGLMLWVWVIITLIVVVMFSKVLMIFLSEKTEDKAKFIGIKNRD